MQRGLINHLDLSCADLSASIAFYDKVLRKLGYAPLSDYGGSVPCWGLTQGSYRFSIGLHQATVKATHDRYAPGLHHLAFHLSSRAEIDDFHAFLVAHSVRVLDAPAEYDYTPGYYAVFFADPDGIKLELVYEPRFDQPL